MKGTRNVALLVVLALVLILGVWGCAGYNSLVKQDEVVTKSWANVNAEYQKRMDLVDNLVNTVKGAANFEKETYIKVVEARTNAQSVKLTENQLTPENLERFERAQAQLAGSLRNMISVVVENYPQLKATQNFQQLQGQLEGIENDIRASRTNYNSAVNTYNVKVRSFPLNLLSGIFGFSRKAPFKADEGAEKAPKVQF
jgi:LemA protein